MENIETSESSFKYVSRCLLVILRLHLGVILLITVTGKIFGNEPFAVEMTQYLQGVARRNAPEFYQNFVDQVVLTHANLFSYLVMWGESVAGISLLLGLFTRVGAVVAMFLFVNYMFSKGSWFWSPNSEDAAVFFSALVCCLGAAGRVYGIDAYLARRWPKAIFW
jgi:thiosulfate dehydrogenase [quinone] large subunit